MLFIPWPLPCQTVFHITHSKQIVQNLIAAKRTTALSLLNDIVHFVTLTILFSHST